MAKSSFSLKVIEIILAIPSGKWTMNGCIARLIFCDHNNEERSDCPERSFLFVL